MTTAVVTGVSGQDGFFSARHLLNQGVRVVGVSRTPPVSWHVQLLYRHPNYTHWTVPVYTPDCVGDITKRVQPNKWIHAAGFRDIPQTADEVSQCYFTNVALSEMIVASIEAHSPMTRLLFISSAEIYGKGSEIADESTPYDPQNDYAVSKIQGMQVMADFNARGGFGATAICYNHDSFLSPADHLIVRVPVQLLKHGPAATFFNTDVRRDFSHAIDFASAFDLILAHHCPDQFNVCRGRSIMLSEYIRLCCRLLAIDTDAVGQYSRPEIESYDRVGSSDKLKKCLNWHPQYDLERMARNIILWKKRGHDD